MGAKPSAATADAAVEPHLRKQGVCFMVVLCEAHAAVLNYISVNGGFLAWGVGGVAVVSRGCGRYRSHLPHSELA